MTFDDAFKLSLARFDRAAETLRKYVTDPDHVNKDSKEMNDAREELVWSIDEVSRLKNAWATARQREEETAKP